MRQRLCAQSKQGWPRAEKAIGDSGGSE
jgi:hypothetical protein